MYEINGIIEDWGRNLNRKIMGIRKGVWKLADHEGKKEWKNRSAKDGIFFTGSGLALKHDLRRSF